MWAQLSKGGVGLQDTPPGRPNPHKNQQDRGGGGGSAGGGGYQQRHHGKQQGRQSQGHMGGPSLQQAAQFLQNTPKLQQSNQQHDKVLIPLHRQVCLGHHCCLGTPHPVIFRVGIHFRVHRLLSAW